MVKIGGSIGSAQPPDVNFGTSRNSGQRPLTPTGTPIRSVIYPESDRFINDL
jgi:hypothetical protein